MLGAPAANQRDDQIRRARLPIAFGACRHHELVGAVLVVKQSLRRHVLARCGRAIAAAQRAERELLDEVRGTSFL